MRKLIIKEYIFNNSELVLVDPMYREEYRITLEFRYFDAPNKGSVIYLPETCLSTEPQPLIFGPIGVSPLARWMPAKEDEFLLIHPKDEQTATLLQRYYP